MKQIFSICILLCTFSFQSIAQEQDSVMGFWLTDDESLIIEITECEAGSPNVCGFIRDFYKQSAEYQILLQNADILCGIPLISNLSRNEEKSRWDDGQIFDLETETMYGVILKITDGNLIVRAYDKYEFMGLNYTWKRTSPTNESCVQTNE